MRLYAKDEAQALEFATRAHQHMISTDARYAHSVGTGETKAWSLAVEEREPSLQGIGELGKPTGRWYILLEDKVIAAFTAKELTGTEPPYEPPKGMP